MIRYRRCSASFSVDLVSLGLKEGFSITTGLDCLVCLFVNRVEKSELKVR
jgi:hypothetical protein